MLVDLGMSGIRRTFKVFKVMEKKENSLYSAVQERDFERVKGCVRQGDSIDELGENGQSPLGYAAQQGLLEYVDYLIKVS